MKLVRYGRPGKEKPGLIDDDGKLRDLSKKVKDITADVISPAGLKALAKLNVDRLPMVKGKQRLGIPVAGIRKCVCIGLNYSDHAAETGSPIPKEPIIFNKWTTALIGATDPVLIPKASVKTDWEVELAVVIGRRASNVPEAKALSYVAGYTIVNDVSERELQIERGGSQWDKGKGLDTYGPVGPWLVTRDEIKDPQNLDMWLDVNGERMQSGNTRTMIFSIKHLVSYCSRYMTLEPGDVISTGTPPGVGLGKKPQVFLKPGDVMTLGIQGLGAQRQELRAGKF